MMLFCKQNQINYSKLTDNEKHWLVEICKKSNLLKGGASQRGKLSKNRERPLQRGFIYLCSAEGERLADGCSLHHLPAFIWLSFIA